MSSGLVDPLPGLVADASAVINLLASGVARPVLGSLPVRLRVVKDVSSELAAGQRRGWNSSDRLAELVDEDLVDIVELDKFSHECFESLVAGAAVDTLDDGEAATIAYALAARASALIDERKARRICALRFPALPVHPTLALLTSSHVTTLLGVAPAAEAVFNALNIGRMRVPAEDYQRVVAIIGAERALQCSSLPEHIRDPKWRRVG